MSDFYGAMDWPLARTWTCIVCGDTRLLWGMSHGECCCVTCHTLYRMLDVSQPDRPRVDTPIPRLRDEFIEPAKLAWANWQKPVDQLSLAEWAEVGAPIEMETQP